MRAKLTALIILLSSILAGPVRAQDTPSRSPGSLSVGAGSFNTGHARTSRGVGLEYRIDSHPWRPVESRRLSLIPVFGITGSSRSALFAYAGFRADVDLAAGWRLTPGFAVGGYRRNGDVDLGGPVEFRSSLDISRAVTKRMRLGVTLYHISNARLYDRNPGVNAMAFVQTF